MSAVLSAKSGRSATFSPRSGSPVSLKKTAKSANAGIILPKSAFGNLSLTSETLRPLTPLSPKSATRDAFDTFLAKRPNGQLQEVPVWPSLDDPGGIKMPDKVVEEAIATASGMMSVLKAKQFQETNPFSTFLQMRPPKKLQMKAKEAALNEEILRTKRQLLEVALIDEMRSIDPTRLGEDNKRRIHRLNRASKCLAEQMVLQHGMSVVLGGFDVTAPPQLEPVRRSTITRDSASMPALKGTATALAAFADAGQRVVFREELKEKLNLVLPPMATGPPPKRRVPLLSGWWTDTRTWNTKHPLDSKARLVRQDPSKGGGCIAIGNGRIPLYEGGHIVCPGYFYSFRVDSIDDEHFPRGDPRMQTIAFGVSRVPGSDKRCLKPNEAFEIPESVVVGYSKQLIDRGRWKPYRSFWDPSALDVGDVVGVLVPVGADKAGDFVVFVNGEQKLRLACSLAKDEQRKDEHERRVLYPLIDLHGRVTSVTLLTNTVPPTSVLSVRNKSL